MPKTQTPTFETNPDSASVIIVEQPVKTPTRYLVKTKSGEYSGKTLGIQFQRGQAIVEELTIDKSLQRTVEDIVWFFQNDFHYEVTPIG